MSLIVESTASIFDTDEITRGSLMFAQHSTWDEGVSGIVTEVNEKYIRLQFLPSINNVINHTTIQASDVVAGYWTIRYSTDGMETVTEYPEAESEEEAEGGT